MFYFHLADNCTSTFIIITRLLVEWGTREARQTSKNNKRMRNLNISRPSTFFYLVFLLSFQCDENEWQ